ncbi:serine/threonine-protein kinase [Archangium lipolyticum]|uniref:serine/threonine-protein kinase n=1 Tax=Archangium lipolyticum TaxID=2970465 RepID=UPI002149C76B|nr:serine/threonine-protein kinase [Archangium lipolyticum]
MATYLALLFVLWGVMLGIDALLFTLIDARYTFFDSPMTWLRVAAILLSGSLWLWLRRGTRALSTLAAIDLGATFTLAALLGVFLSQFDSVLGADFVFILVLSMLFTARAGIVPSTPLRTVLVGVLCSVPIALGTWWSHTHGKDPAYVPSPGFLAGLVLLWCLVSVVLCAFISHVIYGLQRKVREAMRLGQYTLEERIGEGGMGVVYRARHALLRRPTAIKLLPPERAGESAIARFEREVQVTCRLTHPNTIALYDFGRTPEGVFYYAMEYLEGIDLEALVRADGPQPPGRVRSILQQVAGALAEAHAAGLVHRDVKPANVFLCERGGLTDFVKVLDFGLVRELSQGNPRSSGSVGITGTPLYLSPEAITSPEKADARSDLYSLGAVAWFLLTGEPVFSAGTVMEVCARHLHAPPLPPSERLGRPLPESLERLILACLEKDPARRPPSATALLRGLAACEDVPAWSEDDARAWWARHSREPRHEAAPPEAPRTLTVTRVGRRAA